MKCILCHTSMEKFLFKNSYWIYKCPECHFGQTDLRRDYSSFVRDHYSQGYFSGDPTRSAYANYALDKPVIVKNMHKFLSHILKYKKKGKLLDVGCAYGYFVELAYLAGFDAYGFDVSEHAADQAKKLVGAKRIEQGLVNEMKYPPASFDVITLFDVFEHLADPIGDLTILRKLLAPGGIIVIATGNTESSAARAFGRRWTFYIPPQHLSFFTKTNMKTFLSQIGFDPLEWFKIGKWLSLDYVLHLAKTTGESYFARLVHKAIGATPVGRLPLYVPMGDNMVVVAQRK